MQKKFREQSAALSMLVAVKLHTACVLFSCESLENSRLITCPPTSGMQNASSFLGMHN